MTKDKVITEYKGHPVIVGNYRNFSYNKRHLQNNLELIESAVKRHNKIYSWRMDIRMPEDKNKTKFNKTPKQFIKDFMSSYTNNLARKGLDPGYVVKMEQKTSEHPHFHVQMLVDGNKVKDHKNLAILGERLIEKQLGMEPGKAEGLIQYSSPKYNNKNAPGKKSGHMIRRESPYFQEQLDNCFMDMSYLVKDDTNDKIPSNERKIFYSRYKRKKCRSKQ